MFDVRALFVAANLIGHFLLQFSAKHAVFAEEIVTSLLPVLLVQGGSSSFGQHRTDVQLDDTRMKPEGVGTARQYRYPIDCSRDDRRRRLLIYRSRRLICSEKVCLFVGDVSCVLDGAGTGAVARSDVSAFRYACSCIYIVERKRERKRQGDSEMNGDDKEQIDSMLRKNFYVKRWQRDKRTHV